VIGAQLFKAKLSDASKMMTLISPLLELDAFKKAHPLNQVGAPSSI
jgi:hypothetical protein